MKDEITSATKAELDQEEAALRAEAEAISPVRAEDATIPDEPSEAEQRAAAAREQQASKKTARPGGDKKPDASGAKPDASKATAKAQKPGEAPTTQPDPNAAKPDDSKLTPFQKERRRLDDTWKQVAADKEQLRKERADLDTARRQLAEQQQQRSAKPPEKPKIENGTAEDWEAVAADFKAEGKTAAAEKAAANAAKLREQEKAQAQSADARGAKRERFTAEERQTMQTQWQTNLETLGKENPELTQEGSPLRARVAELLKTTPLLHMSGDGIRYAVEFAKVELRAKQADELTAKVAELEKENERLTGLTSLPSGGASPGAQAKKFDELSLAEQEAALREEAAAQQ